MRQGLRTLVVATKEIPEEEWAEWDANYQAAAADLDNRDEKARHQKHAARKQKQWSVHTGCVLSMIFQTITYRPQAHERLGHSQRVHQ